jgi:phosphatidate cytidylyltransferase
MSDPEPKVRTSRNFRQRTIVVLVGIPVVAAAVWFGDPWMTLLAAAWGVGAAWEFYQIIRKSRGLAPMRTFGLLWTFLFIISPHAGRIPFFQKVHPASLLLTTAVIIPLIILLWRKGKENAFMNWAWTIGGILYIGWLLSYFVSLRGLDDGHGGWVFLALLCTFSSDIFAYLLGRAFGKHKMAPYISPNKSWEGAAAGVAAAAIISVAVVFLFSLPLNNWQAAVLGGLISVFGQLGDLVKSLFKRNMQVKDSGNVLPGHGGFLDRMDSLAFAGVLVYAFAAIFTILA